MYDLLGSRGAGGGVLMELEQFPSRECGAVPRDLHTEAPQTAVAAPRTETAPIPFTSE